MSDETPAKPMSKSDMVLLRRAVNARWPIPESERPAIVTQMCATVAGADDDRSRIAAAKVLAAMDKLNMDQEKRDELGTAADVHHHAISGTLEIALAKVYGGPPA